MKQIQEGTDIFYPTTAVLLRKKCSDLEAGEVIQKIVALTEARINDKIFKEYSKEAKYIIQV